MALLRLLILRLLILGLLVRLLIWLLLIWLLVRLLARSLLGEEVCQRGHTSGGQPFSHAGCPHICLCRHAMVSELGFSNRAHLIAVAVDDIIFSHKKLMKMLTENLMLQKYAKELKKSKIQM